jgi:hypothetical protein
MTSRQAKVLFLCSLLAVPVGAHLGFGLWFAPGWANGWPGLPQRVIWPAGLTVVGFLSVLFPLLGLGMLLCSWLCGNKRQAARWTTGTWVSCAVAFALLVSWWVYVAMHATAEELWP